MGRGFINKRKKDNDSEVSSEEENDNVAEKIPVIPFLCNEDLFIKELSDRLHESSLYNAILNGEDTGSTFSFNCATEVPVEAPITYSVLTKGPPQFRQPDCQKLNQSHGNSNKRVNKPPKNSSHSQDDLDNSGSHLILQEIRKLLSTTSKQTVSSDIPANMKNGISITPTTPISSTGKKVVLPAPLLNASDKTRTMDELPLDSPQTPPTQIVDLNYASRREAALGSVRNDGDSRNNDSQTQALMLETFQPVTHSTPVNSVQSSGHRHPNMLGQFELYTPSEPSPFQSSPLSHKSTTPIDYNLSTSSPTPKSQIGSLSFIMNSSSSSIPENSNTLSVASESDQLTEGGAVYDTFNNNDLVTEKAEEAVKSPIVESRKNISIKDLIDHFSNSSQDSSFSANSESSDHSSSNGNMTFGTTDNLLNFKANANSSILNQPTANPYLFKTTLADVGKSNAVLSKALTPDIGLSTSNNEFLKSFQTAEPTSISTELMDLDVDVDHSSPLQPESINIANNTKHVTFNNEIELINSPVSQSPIMSDEEDEYKNPFASYFEASANAKRHSSSPDNYESSDRSFENNDDDKNKTEISNFDLELFGDYSDLETDSDNNDDDDDMFPNYSRSHEERLSELRAVAPSKEKFEEAKKYFESLYQTEEALTQKSPPVQYSSSTTTPSSSKVGKTSFSTDNLKAESGNIYPSKESMEKGKKRNLNSVSDFSEEPVRDKEKKNWISIDDIINSDPIEDDITNNDPIENIAKLLAEIEQKSRSNEEAAHFGFNYSDQCPSESQSNINIDSNKHFSTEEWKSFIGSNDGGSNQETSYKSIFDGYNIMMNGTGFYEDNENNDNEPNDEQYSMPLQPPEYYKQMIQKELENYLEDVKAILGNDASIPKSAYINRDLEYARIFERKLREYREPLELSENERRTLLQNVFDKMPKLNKVQVKYLSEMTGLTEKSIRIWFSNRRSRSKKQPAGSKNNRKKRKV